mmetsp:Transcript_4468/g.6564  ORF Transcript_4468/g.6564 Transcript_4468/m.6564 type:complete len:225 (+) Transcript_4468:1368-2042(+)
MGARHQHLVGCQALKQHFVIALWHLAHVVKCSLEPARLLQQGKALAIVHKVGALYLQALGLHQGSLLKERVAVEVTLQLLIGVVDAELLEPILCKRLEPEDVEHSHLLLPPTLDPILALNTTHPHGSIDQLNNTLEDLAVELLAQGLEAQQCIGSVLGLAHGVTSRGDDASAQPLLELSRTHLQQLRRLLDAASLDIDSTARVSVKIVFFPHLNVAHVQDCRHA